MSYYGGKVRSYDVDGVMLTKQQIMNRIKGGRKDIAKKERQIQKLQDEIHGINYYVEEVLEGTLRYIARKK